MELKGVNKVGTDTFILYCIDVLNVQDYNYA